jgi:RNA polymerase sigma-32 factor
MAKKKIAKKKTTPTKAAKKTSSASKKTPAKKGKPEVRHVEAEIVETDKAAAPSADLDLELDGDLEESSETSSRLPAPIQSRAVTSKDPITTYLQEIRKYPVLTREQEFELAKRYYETKDPAAAQALVTANLRFVVKVAAEYSKFGARLIDLVQEGNMGLMHAVRDFNPYKGVRLITYAVWWIRGYIQEYLMKQYSLVKIGTTQNQKKLFYRLQKEKEALDAMGEVPDMALIGSKLGIPEEEVKEMAQRLKGRDVSLNQTLDDESKSSLLDFQKTDQDEPDVALARREEIELLKDRLEKLRPQLSEREMILLNERLLADEPLTLQEIGEKYGITREAVRQMETRLLEKIRKSLQNITDSK